MIIRCASDVPWYISVARTSRNSRSTVEPRRYPADARICIALSAALCAASDAASFAIDASTRAALLAILRVRRLPASACRAASSSVAMSASIH